VPFFGDIPILGILFQRRRASDARGELVIFITPPHRESRGGPRAIVLKGQPL